MQKGEHSIHGKKNHPGHDTILNASCRAQPTFPMYTRHLKQAIQACGQYSLKVYFFQFDFSLDLEQETRIKEVEDVYSGVQA